MSKIIVDKDIDFIEGNPFYRRVEDSPSAMWVLENEHRVKGRIRNTFIERGHGVYDVDECYDYMIYYFIENTDKEFDPDYFNNQDVMDEINNAETLEELKEIERTKLKQTEYKLEYYVMKRVYMEALGYLRNLDRDRSTCRYAEIEESESNGYINSNVISMDVATASQKDRRNGLEENPNKILEFMELQEILECELHIYDEEFEMRGLKNFKTRQFIEAAFLSDLDDEQEMADKLNQLLPAFQQHKNGFRLIVKDKTGLGDDFRDLLDSVSRLIEGKLNGWEPKLSI